MVLHGPLFIYCLCSGLKTAAIDIGCNTFTEHKINAYNRLHFLHICSDCCRHLNGLAITLHHKTTKAPTFAPRHSVKLNFGLKYNDILSQPWLSCLFCRSLVLRSSCSLPEMTPLLSRLEGESRPLQSVRVNAFAVSSLKKQRQGQPELDREETSHEPLVPSMSVKQGFHWKNSRKQS